MENKIRIIDQRSKAKFIIDDEYLNGYAKLCGIYATGVYMSICRHSNKNQSCFPSIGLIARELSVSVNSVKKGIKNLKEWGIISVHQEKKENGIFRNNKYILLDKSVWKPKPYRSPNKATDDNRVFEVTDPELSGDDNRVSDKANKETNDEGNTYKETHNIALRANDDISDYKFIFQIFEKNLGQKLIPLIEKNGFDLNIAAAKRLVQNYGRENIKKILEQVFYEQERDIFFRISNNPVKFEKNISWYQTRLSQKEYEKKQRSILKL